MAREKHTVEQIIAKLREAEDLLGQGGTVADAYRSLAVTEQTCSRWRKEYGGLTFDQAKCWVNLVRLSATASGLRMTR